MKKQLLALALAVCMALLTTACQPEAKQSGSARTILVQTLPDAPEVDIADPAAALEEIYESVEIQGIEDATPTVLADKFFIEPEMLTEDYVRYSTGRFGLADVFILRPAQEQQDIVREKLEDIKLARMSEFVDYDIYDAHQIAQDAVIFEQSGYLIMLMLADNDAARAIIDRYIPKN